MITVRKAKERGHFNHGWLDTYHTFSFADYHDPEHVRFRSLRVMNEDFIAAGEGFGTHGHRDMEIVTCVLQGALQHRDSMGNSEVLKPGEFQRITAGTGITHSEFNPSSEEPTHLYQIWLFPSEKGLTPGYEQKSFAEQFEKGELFKVASPDGAERSLTIHQDATIYLGRLAKHRSQTIPVSPGRHAWLQMLDGEITLNEVTLRTGDGAAVSEVETLSLTAEEASQILLFDLA